MITLGVKEKKKNKNFLSFLTDPSMLPAAIQVSYLQLVILREMVVTGAPMAGSTPGYDPVAEATLECTYLSLMQWFEGAWKTFLEQRPTYIQGCAGNRNKSFGILFSRIFLFKKALREKILR
jgi:hypothetical protein